jgi:hypothetical protein
MSIVCSVFLSALLAAPSFAQSPAQSATEPKNQNQQSAQKFELQSLKQPLAFGLDRTIKLARKEPAKRRFT